MIQVSYFANLIILLPLLFGFATNARFVDAAYGPPTEARAILASVYGAIAIASVAGLFLLWSGHPWALPAAAAIFGLQIIYKLLTIPAVGLGNPVIVTNLAVSVLHGITIVVMLGGPD